jgi:hypothetical protein
MKKLAVFLGLFALAFWIFARSSSMKDTMDFVLVGIAAFLLAGVAFFLLLVPLYFYRLIRHRRGSEIRDDGFVYHGALKSKLVRWDQIDMLEIRMESTVHIRPSGSVSRSKLEFPNLYLHQAGGGEEVPVMLDDMPTAIAAIQEHLRANGPRYTQREIDWVERWRAADASVEGEAEEAEPEEPEDDEDDEDAKEGSTPSRS